MPAFEINFLLKNMKYRYQKIKQNDFENIFPSAFHILRKKLEYTKPFHLVLADTRAWKKFLKLFSAKKI